MRSRRRKAFTLAIAIAALGALGTLAAAAGAVVPGENGRIVFASGRGAGGDAQARLFLLPVPSSTGGGTVSPAIGPAFAGQYRHPTWSPDRTRIAYAQGTPTGVPATENFDIFVHDLDTNAITPITNTGDSLSADRPAWSPDGTRIAYEHQPTDNSAERDIRVQTVGTMAAPLDLTSGAPFEGKPAWTPDSQTIYYGRTNTFNDLDIVREPATGGTVQDVVHATGIDEFQPAIAADGSRICFTLQTPGNPSSADVIVTTLPTPATVLTDLSDNAVGGDYNCTWSPDGQQIAYVTGTFSAGALVMERSDDTSPSPIELTNSPGVFDGNPDWAPDGRPLCPDSTVTTTVNRPVGIAMDCTDTGPAYERSPVKEFVANDGDPANGTVGEVTFGDPSTATYTPNRDFIGTDSLQFTGFDDLGFATDRGTITIVVGPGGGGPGGGGPGGGNGTPPTCGGRTATVVGTAGDDTLSGTDGADVIVGLGGNDTLRAGRGADIACGGSGRDRIVGGTGNDRASGNAGNDRLTGSSGNDRLTGASGNDRLSGGSGRDRLTGNSGRDRLSGGPARDRLTGNSGRDRLDGGSGRDRCTGGGGRDRETRCERS